MIKKSVVFFFDEMILISVGGWLGVECWRLGPKKGGNGQKVGVGNLHLEGDSVIGLTKPREKPCEWSKSSLEQVLGTKRSDVNGLPFVDVGVSNVVAGTVSQPPDTCSHDPA